MATALDPLLAVAKLYHFTDVRNLPMIKNRGVRCAQASLSAEGAAEEFLSKT